MNNETEILFKKLYSDELEEEAFNELLESSEKNIVVTDEEEEKGESFLESVAGGLLALSLVLMFAVAPVTQNGIFAVLGLMGFVISCLIGGGGSGSCDDYGFGDEGSE
jgi:hypothetical protein